MVCAKVTASELFVLGTELCHLEERNEDQPIVLSTYESHTSNNGLTTMIDGFEALETSFQLVAELGRGVQPLLHKHEQRG